MRCERDAESRLVPRELRAIHPPGGAPIIIAADPVLAASGAIIECLIGKHGGGRLATQAGPSESQIGRRIAAVRSNDCAAPVDCRRQYDVMPHSA